MKQKDLQNLFNRGFGQECYLVEAIKAFLLTEPQRKEMFDLNVSIEDVLNGRVGKPAFTDNLFKQWNTVLGFKYFSY